MRAPTGSLHGQPSVERPSPIVPDGRPVHDYAGLAGERSKGGSTDARRRHRHRVLLHSTRHHSHTTAHLTGVAGPACTNCGRPYQPAFDNVKRRLQGAPGAYAPDVGGPVSGPQSARERRANPGSALKHDGDPLPGSPPVIPQRAHGRVGRVLWEIGTRTLKLASAPKVATRDLQSQLPYLESPLRGRSSVG
jgi:hypothetical protein